jgi:beta-xylosidase
VKSNFPAIMKRVGWNIALLAGLTGICWGNAQAKPMKVYIRVTVTSSSLEGIGEEEGVMRRDPSDIIKVNDLYYVWYTKGAFSHGYDASVFYATSPDGRKWTEKGEALARGPQGSWDEQSVFTPNILVAEGKYWLFYTAVSKPFFNSGPNITKTAIGIAVSESPDGPWTRLESNPVLNATDDPAKFDSLRVDDACLVVRDGKFWLYFKGRQWGKSYTETKMGVAIADKPEGPYVRHPGNPVVPGGHEVVVWPYGKGVVARIGGIGAPEVRHTLQYSEDGLNFAKMMNSPRRFAEGAGAYRPEAFTDSGKGMMIEWGVDIRGRQGALPFIGRFDCEWQTR